jgi:hypothetical protein
VAEVVALAAVIPAEAPEEVDGLAEEIRGAALADSAAAIPVGVISEAAALAIAGRVQHACPLT